MSVAIVTGAGKGIGRAVALKLAQEGYTVIANYRSELKDIEELQAEAKELGSNIIPMQADVSNEEACKEMVKKTVEIAGTPSVLVNNAGITADGLFLRMSEEKYSQVMDINAKSVFFMMKHVAAAMLKKRSGSIINMSSVSGILGTAGQLNYAASKAAVIAMTKTAARELAGAGIRVNAIAPGFIETRMSDELSDKVKEKYLEQIAMKRFGKVEEIAETVNFLASDKASYITGICLAVDGGISM